jgi:hypothetical protein
MLLAVTAALALVEPPEKPLCAEQACPTVRFAVRSNNGLDRVLTGARFGLYRAQPELFIGFRPLPGVSLIAGGGAGPAVVVHGGGKHTHHGVGFTSSGALGARVVVNGTLMLAIARVEAVIGHAPVVTLELRVTFGP